MKQGRLDTIMTRIISTTFVVVALAVFKPFGLGAWTWQSYVHLAALWVIGIIACTITELIVKYIVHKPRSFDKGVSYIIRRNLYFQIINTPFVALGICLYRHYVISQYVEGNQFSLVNFLETLVIIAFCSFAIGLYWRFKYRSRYLVAELEETKALNEQIKNMAQPDKQEKPETLTLEGSTNDKVTLDILHLLYIEAVGNYVKICQLHDNEVRTDMLRATMKQVEDNLQPYPMIVRCHRAFMVNLGQVEQISSNARAMQLIMRHSHDAIPVSRSNMAQVKEAINGVD
jgi:DNA-binding LytR/AlgR family response regulator